MYEKNVASTLLVLIKTSAHDQIDESINLKGFPRFKLVKGSSMPNSFSQRSSPTINELDSLIAAFDTFSHHKVKKISLVIVGKRRRF